MRSNFVKFAIGLTLLCAASLYLMRFGNNPSKNTPPLPSFSGGTVEAVSNDLSWPVKQDAFWVWDGNILKSEAKANDLFNVCRDHDIGLIFIYVSYIKETSYPLWQKFIKRAHLNGIRVHALFGKPQDAISSHHSKVLRYVESVIAYNSLSEKEERFHGLHADIEFYSLEGVWPEREGEMIENFLTLLEKITLRLEQLPDLKLGVDMPYWFDAYQDPGEKNHRPIVFDWKGVKKDLFKHIIDIADYTTVMAFSNIARGSAGEGIIDMASNEADYAAAEGKPIYAGIDIDLIGYEKFYRKEIPQVREYFKDNTSFQGIAIHNYTGYLNLIKENAHDNVAFEHAFYRSPPADKAGTLHVFVRNDNEFGLSVRKVFVNDEEVTGSPDENFLWYQILPNPIPAGRISDIMVRRSRDQTSFVEIRLEFENGRSLTRAVEPKPALARITGINFDPALRYVYVYVENAASREVTIDRISINAIDATGQSEHLFDRIPSGAKGCIVVDSTDLSIEEGDHISVRVLTSEGDIAQNVVKVISKFPINAWMADTREEMFYDAEDFRFNPKESYPVDNPKGLYLVDDPNCSDRRGGQALGYTANYMVEMAARYREQFPRVPTYSHICEHRKEEAYFVYGETMDMVFVNPYEIVFHGGSPRDDGKYINMAKKGCEPRPVLAVPEAFFEEFPDGAGRVPTPEEEKLLVHYQIGQGAKGLLYFIKTMKNGKGYEHYPDLEQEIGRINRTLQRIKHLLWIGEPFPQLVLKKPSWLDVYPLLCADRALILILINRDYRYSAYENALIFDEKGSSPLKLVLPGAVQLSNVEDVSLETDISGYRIGERNELEMTIPWMRDVKIIKLDFKKTG